MPEDPIDLEQTKITPTVHTGSICDRKTFGRGKRRKAMREKRGRSGKDERGFEQKVEQSGDVTEIISTLHSLTRICCTECGIIPNMLPGRG